MGQTEYHIEKLSAPQKHGFDRQGSGTFLFKFPVLGSTRHNESENDVF